MSAIAQVRWILDVSVENSPPGFDMKNYDIPKQVGTVQAGLGEIRNLLAYMRRNGMLEAGLDSFHHDSSSIRAVVHAGPVYKWGYLNFRSIPRDFLPPGVRDLSSGKKFLPEQIADVFNQVLRNFENNGFPFASIQLDSILIEKESIRANVLLNKGELFVYDSIYLSGNSALSRTFLEKYLHIEKGTPYSEEVIRKIDSRLGRLPYVKVLAPTRVYFGMGKVRLQMQLDEKAADRIDGIIGFAPNSDQNANNLLLTGEFNLEMRNLFNRGTGFLLHWKSFLQQSQELDLEFSYPYLFRTNLGLDGGLELIKLDTTFLRLNSEIGARVLLGGLDFLRFFYQSQNTTLLSVDTLAVRINRTLPVNNPVQVRAYGMECYINTLDYPLNPYRGYSFRTKVTVGSRTIKRHPDIDNVLFPGETGALISVYDQVNLRSTQLSFGYEADIYVPTGKNSTFRCYSTGDQLIAGNIMRNDLFRFGGSRSLRGFDEKSLEASSVHQLHLEYRYLFNRDANFHLFANSAYYENNVSANSGLFSDIPFGFGAGVNLSVGNGVLNLDYALGSQKGNPIQLNQAKIHFGIINYL